jgi:glucosylceramidase
MRRPERSLLGVGAAWLIWACSSSESPSPAAGAGGSASNAGGSGAGAVGGASGGTSGGGGGAGATSSSGGDTSQGGSSGTSQGGGSSGAPQGGSGGEPVVVERPPLVTSGQGEYWKVGTFTTVSEGTATVTVDLSSALQTWRGFGGTFNEAGWDALSELPQAERERAIKLLFSPAEGANFAWGRIPLGASDYALSRYTLDDSPNHEPDPNLMHFSIERDKMALIPYIKAAQAVKSDIKFWASPWTPPPWMKNPAQYDGTDEGPNGNPPATYEAFMKNDPTVLQAYADYFVRFIKAYEEEGIPIDHVQPQNEPGYDTRYPSCLWSAGLLTTFVANYLGPTLAKETPNTKIWFGTLSNNDAYPNQTMGLSSALNYITGVGLQWNTMGRIPSLLGMKSDLLIMQTEHRCGNYPFTVNNPAPFQPPAFNPNQAQNDHAYGMESWYYIRQWIKAGVHVYSAWNMVLDTVGKNLDAQRPWPQNALLVVDRAQDKLIETPAYYVFRHLSFFVDPGATHLNTTGGDALAFKNPDQSVVTVLFNANAQTSDTIVALGDTKVQVQVPGYGFATIYWKAEG